MWNMTYLPIIALGFFGGAYGLLIALAWKDLRSYVLPNVMNAALAICFVGFHASLGWQLFNPLEMILGAVAGAGLLLLVRYVAWRLTGKIALGMGDVKLMGAAGLGLGLQGILLAISLGAFIGLLHGLLLAILQGKKEAKSVAQINVPAGLGFAVAIGLVFWRQVGLSWF